MIGCGVPCAPRRTRPRSQSCWHPSVEAPSAAWRTPPGQRASSRWLCSVRHLPSEMSLRNAYYYYLVALLCAYLRELARTFGVVCAGTERVAAGLRRCCGRVCVGGGRLHVRRRTHAACTCSVARPRRRRPDAGAGVAALHQHQHHRIVVTRGGRPFRAAEQPAAGDGG
eukprot:SAG25_NODE_1478_length_2942_cov_11.625747_2_plen_169_part_00